MTSFAIILVLISALMHASWNLICKSRRPSAAFFLIATTASVIIYFPVTIYLSSLWRYIPSSVWVLLIFTSVAQTIYYISLGNAYERCEVSIAYPMIRALPVLFIPAIMFIFKQGQGITTMALVGMLLLAFGCIILPMKKLKEFLKDIFSKAYIFIVLAAFGTTSYTIIDSKALHALKTQTALFTYAKATLVYISIENIFILLLLFVYVFYTKKEKKILQQLIKDRVWQPMFSGVICSASYTIILVAMLFVSNVSYVAAFRQVSIPLGAILGIIIFKEKLSLPKAIGIILISLGLLVVALY